MRASLALSLSLSLAACSSYYEPVPQREPVPIASVATPRPSAYAAHERTFDRDGDRIDDAHDRCPDEPEDIDGFEDEDGCPDPDNDRDGILDRCDKCPNEPEIYNGFEDEDGCPDRGRVLLKSSEIVIVQHVQFARGSKAPARESQPVIDAIAQVLKHNPQIELIGLTGHASTDERSPRELGFARAKAVVDALIALGVEPHRLMPFSAAADLPRAQKLEPNRRVEARVMQMSGDVLAVPGPNGPLEAPSTRPPRVVPPAAAPAQPGCP